MDPLTRAAPGQPGVPFSLFAGDLFNRIFNHIWLSSRSVTHLAGRSLALSGVTWGPMAVFAACQGLYSAHIEARNFFADYAAYGQFIIAIPLFVVAERVVDRHTRDAARQFLLSGAIAPRDLAKVGPIHARVRRMRLDKRAERAWFALAYLLSFFTIGPEMIGRGPQSTWHTGAGAQHAFTFPGGLTIAGAWLMFAALPILNYIWIRLAWKIVIWTTYLYRMSRLQLQIVASHPDLTGGIGFISTVQAKWAIVIFAYGVSNVAAVIAYKVGIEHASPLLMPVWAPAVGFVILAPSLFTVPLLMFTRALFRAKRRAMAAYRGHVRELAVSVESRWFSAHVADGAQLGDLANLNSMAAALARVEQMRVVPFDLKSFSQLIGSTVGSISVALPILRFEGTLKDWLDFIARLFGG
jgi:hypothetical protein